MKIVADRVFAEWRWLPLACLLAAGTTAGAAEPSRAQGPCSEVSRERDFLAAATGDGGVTLASGRKITLVDLRVPPEPLDAAVRSGREAVAVLRSFAGSAVEVTAYGTADRWERVPASLSLGGGAAGVDVAELLVGEGLAMVDSGERDGLCRPDLLRLEERARVRRAGLWSAAEVLPAGDPERIGKESGRFGIVEGRILSVGERRDRTYLNFGRDFGRDFSVSVPKRNWAGWKAAGRTAASLKGARVRVRGVVEMRRAPGMEVLTADMLEVLGGSSTRP